NCSPKLGAKLLDRFLHRRRQVSPPANSLTHRFFDGLQHLLYCNVAVGSRHGVVANVGISLKTHGASPCYGFAFARSAQGSHARPCQVPVQISQAAACERRSHSSKPMRPRRASPNGTSERSSTRPPKYRASGSLTTLRGSPIAFR